MFDYHMHSHFSADCKEPMENMIKESIAKGLQEISFTEHIDYEYPDDSIVFEFDLDEYDRTIKAFREQYEGQIIIRKGVEIGVQPHLLTRYEDLMKQEQFDFIICSMHTTDHKCLHYGELFEDRTIEEAYKKYYDELYECVKNYKDFSILGHIDLIKRYAKEQPTALFHDELEAIFKEIIPAGKGIELNTSGVRYGMNNGLPSNDVLKLYKDCGGEIITLGSDAHRISEVAFQFKESLDLLQSIGFKYITTFENLKPTFHKIETL